MFRLLKLSLPFIIAFSGHAFSQVEDQLVGGVLKNRKTKERMGVLCSQMGTVQIGETSIEQCVAYEVVSLNAEDQPTYIRELNTRRSYTLDDIRGKTDASFDWDYDSEVYWDAGFYNNSDPYFFNLFAANLYGCGYDGWGWCLLLPVTAAFDAVATIGSNAALGAYDVTLIAISGVDHVVGNISSKSTRRKVIRDIRYMLNSKKVGKKRTINANRFDALKEAMSR